MKAIYIDSFERKVEEVEINIENDFTEAYKLLNCELIEQVSNRFKNGDCLLVDEEGTLKDSGLWDNMGFTIATDKGIMEIWGSALLVGFGEIQDDQYEQPKTDIEQLKEKIEFVCF